jgi:hypothetical protein
MLGAEMSRDGAVDAATHRNQDAARLRLKLRARCDCASQRAGQRVGGELRGVNLPGAQPAELLADVRRADLRGLEHRRAINQFNRRARGGAGSTAAGSRKSSLNDSILLNADCDSYEITAGSAPGHAAVRAVRHIALPARMAQMVLKTLVSH